MPNSAVDSEAYLAATQFSIGKLFDSFVAQQNALKEIQGQLEAIDAAKQLQHDIFVDRDQWSINANYLYGQFLGRLHQLNAQADAIGDTEQEQIATALARLGATEESMGVFAGAILQVAKQILSYRHGGKSNMPSSRTIGSQELIEIVWEGRNHAMHWEDPTPNARVAAMLAALSADMGMKITPSKNLSWPILAAIGWKNETEMTDEMRTLIQ